jgi:prepilin-type N-terminal cleavage/methylation domain-containing protein
LARRVWRRGVANDHVRGCRRTPTARSRVAPAPGFSLLEILVACVLIAIILAIGIPALNQQMVRGRLTGACEQLAMHLHQARIEAMRKGFPVVVSPDYERQHLVAFVDEVADNQVLDVGEHQIFDVSVPADLSASAVYYMGPDLIQGTSSLPGQSVDGLTPAGTMKVFVFEPDGSIRDVGAFRLADAKTPEANIFEVRVEPAATARIEIRKFLYGGVDGLGSDAFFPAGGGVWKWY